MTSPTRGRHLDEGYGADEDEGDDEQAADWIRKEARIAERLAVVDHEHGHDDRQAEMGGRGADKHMRVEGWAACGSRGTRDGVWTLL